MDVDLLIIGGGSAGYAAASTAASHGASCVLVESAAELGGTCILRGCMPSKTLIETANRFRALRAAPRFGIDLNGSATVAWQRVQDRKRDLIGGFQEYRRQQLTSGDFRLVRGAARFVGASRVVVEDDSGERIQLAPRRTVIATGSEPATPEIDGAKEVELHTSASLLEVERLPTHLVVVGGGVVGMEFAHCFEGLGCRVTLVQRSGRILGPYDPDLSTHLLSASRDRGIEVLLEHEVEDLRPHREGAVVTVRGKSEESGRSRFSADTILLATGRRPRTDRLELAAAGVATDDHGRIKIDRSARTSAPEVFAAGDCASPFPVVHLAVLQGEVAATNALVDLGRLDASHAREWEPAHRMSGIFTHPEAVQLGFAVDEGEEAGAPLVSASYQFADHGKAEIRGCRHGFVKLVAREDNGLLVGASAVGEEVIELAHAVMVAIHEGLDARTFARLPHYHPTLAEIWTYPAEELARATA